MTERARRKVAQCRRLQHSPVEIAHSARPRSPSVGRNDSSGGGGAHARRRQNACRNRCRCRRRRMQSSSMLRRQTQSKVGDAGTAAAAQAQVQQIEAQSGNNQTRPRPNLAKPFSARDGQEKIITNRAGNPPKNKTKLTQLPQSSTKKNPHGAERELASLQPFSSSRCNFKTGRQAAGTCSRRSRTPRHCNWME